MAWGYYGNRQSHKGLLKESLLDNCPSAIAIDVETVSLEDRTALGLSIATSPDDAFWFPANSEHIPWDILNNPNITKVYHNALFDLKTPILYRHTDTSSLADTNIIAHLLGREESSLVALAPEVGMVAHSAKEYVPRGGTMLDVPIGEVASKCCNDAQVTIALYNSWKDKINWTYFKVEMDVIPILIDMGLRGVKIDQKAREEYEDTLSKDITFYLQEAEAMGVNLNAPRQVAMMLARRGNFLPFTKKRTSLSTEAKILEKLDDPMAAFVLNYRGLSKMLSTYIRPMAKEDRFYTEYYIDTVVGRFNSKNRNIQNIPPEARHILVPDNGTFTTGDYSQEHLRILALWSQDREMLRIYNDGHYNGDIHDYTARQLGIGRRLAKTINYAICYGATAQTIMEEAGIKDEARASELLDRWFGTFRGAAEWIRGAQKYGLATGYTLPTLFGRQIKLPSNIKKSKMKKLAANYPLIGSDGDIMKRALIMCKHLPLAITVHDSITCDGDIEFPIEGLENIAPVRIPFEVKKTWRWE